MAMASPRPSGSCKKRRRAANAPQKSTCLICSHSILVPKEETNSEAALKWSRLIKALCFHMQMNSKEIPEHCSTAMFPICPQCEQHVFDVYKSQEKINEEEKRISRAIVTIEQRAAEAVSRESLKPGSISAEGKKLRDRILESHRAKLLMKAKLREQLILEKGKKGKILDLPTCSHTVLMNDPSIRRQFDAGRSGGPSPSTSQGSNAAQNESLPNSGSIPAENDKDIKEQEDQAENSSGSTNVPAEVHDSIGQDNQVPPPAPVIPSTSMVPAARPAPGSPPSRTVAQNNEKSCSMSISKVPCGPASPPLDPSVVAKKAPRQRVLLSNPLSSDISPHQIMTQHITASHLGKRRRAAAQKDASTRDGVAKSYYIPNLQCNICGRPIKGHLSNLEAHKFSHKNNEERLEAIKKKERGARNVTMRKLVEKRNRPGVVNKDSNKVRRLKRSPKRKAFPRATALSKKKNKALILKEKPSSVNGSFSCPHCSRSFSRNCHLSLHMQMHFRKNKVVAVTKALNDEPPFVKDPEVNGTQVENEKPTTFEEQPTSSAEEVSAEFSSGDMEKIRAEMNNPNGNEM